MTTRPRASRTDAWIVTTSTALRNVCAGWSGDVLGAGRDHGEDADDAQRDEQAVKLRSHFLLPSVSGRNPHGIGKFEQRPQAIGPLAVFRRRPCRTDEFRGFCRFIVGARHSRYDRRWPPTRSRGASANSLMTGRARRRNPTTGPPLSPRRCRWQRR